MNRRNLIKLSSLFAVSSIFSASISAIASRRVNAQQYRRVDPSSSSCAERIDAVFRRYGLEVRSFDIVFSDRSGNYYRYASSGSTRALKKIDEQPDAVLLPTSLNKYPSFDNSKMTIAQRQPLHEQVFNAIENVMAGEGVTLFLARLSAIGSNGEPCDIDFSGGTSYYMDRARPRTNHSGS